MGKTRARAALRDHAKKTEGFLNSGEPRQRLGKFAWGVKKRGRGKGGMARLFLP